MNSNVTCEHCVVLYSAVINFNISVSTGQSTSLFKANLIREINNKIDEKDNGKTNNIKPFIP